MFSYTRSEYQTRLIPRVRIVSFSYLAISPGRTQGLWRVCIYYIFFSVARCLLSLGLGQSVIFILFFLLGIGVLSALEAFVRGPSSSEAIFAMCPIFCLNGGSERHCFDTSISALWSLSTWRRTMGCVVCGLFWWWKSSPSVTNVISSCGEGQPWAKAIWLILPVVICLSQRLSHAGLSSCRIKVRPRMAHYISYGSLDLRLHLDNPGNSRANTCIHAPTFGKVCFY